MKISEVMEFTGLTKKAIKYYEEEGLIKPDVNPENNYREYSQDDIDRLIQISVLRQFDVPIKDIHEIMVHPSLLKNKLELHLAKLTNDITRLEKSKNVLQTCLKSYDAQELPQLTNQLSLLNESLQMDARTREGFMKKQFLRMFPGNFGKMLVLNYSLFLHEPIDTQEKEDAWISIVKFLDEAEEIEYPEEIQEMYEKFTEEDMEKYEATWSENIKKWIHITDEGLMKEKEKMLETIQRINCNPDMQLQNKKVSALSEHLRGLMKNIGYYDRFVKNLKMLSKDFCRYTHNQAAFAKLLNLKIDDGGRIVASEQGQETPPT